MQFFVLSQRFLNKLTEIFLSGLGMMETATSFMSFPLYGMLVVVFYRFGQFRRKMLLTAKYNDTRFLDTKPHQS